MIVALALATAALLMVALRAVLVPLVAVALNLVTVAATFGALQLLFGGSDPLLGGPGYIDPMSIIGIFAAVFGISTAYEVFLLARTREQILAGDEPRAAVRHGLRHTAAAVTGTAAVMVAAALPFIAGDMLSVRQFGTAIAIAVLLDALIVRPVVLPAAVELMGRRAWWPTHTAGSGAARPPNRSSSRAGDRPTEAMTPTPPSRPPPSARRLRASCTTPSARARASRCARPTRPTRTRSPTRELAPRRARSPAG